MIVYGLSLDEIADHSAPASGQTFDPERPRYTHLHGDRWSVALWDVPVAHWASVTDTFHDVREIIRRGCVVAWVGAEGFLFSDPPHLFDPRSCRVESWPGVTESGDFACHIAPDEPVTPASDDELRALRDVASPITGR